MKCVLVTGGAGFLGSHLCDRLIESGNYVICLDNFFTGSKENIQHLVGNPNFELEERDIIWPYMKGVDEIYNLACPASPVHYQYDPIKTINTSVFGAVIIHNARELLRIFPEESVIQQTTSASIPSISRFAR